MRTITPKYEIMSIVKSISVGEGDMFYIKHGNDNFTIIDCCLSDDNKRRIVAEVIKESSGKNISRFISTHPDEDHFQGIEYLNERKEIVNFYCVENEATKPDENRDFDKYCELRDSEKAYYVYEGCKRKWLNDDDNERGSSGLHFLWPDINNKFYKEELEKAKKGESFNDISLIVQYSLNNGATILWMGDLGTDFMENIKNDLTLPKVNILFAPHHGRDSGTVPSELLETMDPDIIIIGEADSNKLNYYDGYNTITQNSADDITLDCVSGQVHIYVSSDTYSVDFLDDEKQSKYDNYIGTLNL